MTIGRILRSCRRTGTLLSNESGATAIEYGLIAVVLAVTVFGAMQVLRDPMNALFDQVSLGFAAAR